MLRMRMADDNAGPRAALSIRLCNDTLEAEPGSLERNSALTHGVHPRVAKK